MVHENTIRTQAENMELQLQKQKANTETEYYDILQKQYESSNVLIHDIKRHLLSVKQLALMNDCPAINDYVDSLYQEYTVKNNKVYSDNKLINVIVNRYATAFTENNIDFFCDIRSIDFSFISNADLTAVLDNLLENAFEATLDSEEKTVEFSILITNTRFITLIMNNSCSKKPNIKNQKLITSKNETTIHGYGMKSIQRIVNKYDGTISFNYEEQTNLFSVKIVFELPLN